MRAIRAAWLRGGTSKGVFLLPRDLPPPGGARDALLLAALGSPDPSGLQLNGVGGGISSTSKVAVVSPSQRPGYDLDYVFGQVEIQDRTINWQGSCGNLSAAVGIFGLGEGLVAPSAAWSAAEAPQPVRVWQVNRGYGMVIHVPPNAAVPGTGAGRTADAAASSSAPPPRAVEAMEDSSAPFPLLDLAGVPGREPAVYLELLTPHGDGPLLPTGNVVDQLPLPGGAGTVEATLVTAGNPTVIVAAEAAGLRGAELPAEINYDVVLPLVEHLRAEGARRMGIQVSDQPRVAFVSQPQSYATTTGEHVEATGTAAPHLLSRISTPGRIHHAHTGTGSIALACAAAVEGSVPWRCLAAAARPRPGQQLLLRIGHPAGILEVGATVQRTEDRGWHSLGAGLIRTARYLMRGELFVPTPERAP